MLKVVPFVPRVPIAVTETQTDIFAFTVIDSELKGIKPGYVLCCRPEQKGDRPRFVICEINGELTVKRIQDAEVFVAIVYSIQRPEF